MAAAALMSGLIAVPLAAVPVDDRSPFHFPADEDFRFQHIARSEREQGWPFTVGEGWLICAWILGRPAVYFAEMLPEDADEDETPRTVIVSTDPFEIVFSNMADRDLLVATSGVAEMIPLLAPFERLGNSLCEQPRGSQIGPGEL